MALLALKRDLQGRSSLKCNLKGASAIMQPLFCLLDSEIKGAFGVGFSLYISGGPGHLDRKWAVNINIE